MQYLSYVPIHFPLNPKFENVFLELHRPYFACEEPRHKANYYSC